MASAVVAGATTALDVLDAMRIWIVEVEVRVECMASSADVKEEEVVDNPEALTAATTLALDIDTGSTLTAEVVEWLE